MRKFVFLLGIVFLFSLIPVTGQDLLCKSDSDCPDGYTCANGDCVKEPLSKFIIKDSSGSKISHITSEGDMWISGNSLE
ncbi:MAG: hypothetical protein ACQEP1_04955, partial [Nanobdellota archaeon]